MTQSLHSLAKAKGPEFFFGDVAFAVCFPAFLVFSLVHRDEFRCCFGLRQIGLSDLHKNFLQRFPRIAVKIPQRAVEVKKQVSERVGRGHVPKVRHLNQCL